MPIRDLRKFKKLEAELKNIKSLRYIKPFLLLLGSKGRTAVKNIDAQLAKIPELEEELDRLRNTPDKFNVIFRDHGWIASDDMNMDAMVQAVSIANQEGVESAERFLVNHYNDGVIERWLKTFCFHPFMESPYSTSSNQIQTQKQPFQPENLGVSSSLVFTHWVKEKAIGSANFHPPPRMLKLK